MIRKSRGLNYTIVKNAKSRDKPYKLYDKNGLFILIKSENHKYWRLKYRFAGKEKLLALGVYPEISLIRAREKAFEARRLIADDIDPSEEKKKVKQTLISQETNKFSNIVEMWLKRQKNILTPRYHKQITSRLNNDIIPTLGSKNLCTITPNDLFIVLQKVEERGASETARRLKQIINQIYKYAISLNKVEKNITIGLEEVLTPVRKKHFKKLNERDYPAFSIALDNYTGAEYIKLALKFIILTFVRTDDIRKAKWEDINWEKKEWHIPIVSKSRNKNSEVGRKHIVPLSTQSLSLLEKLRYIGLSTTMIFPSRIYPQTKGISENTMLKVIKEIGFKNKTTVHGFRAFASTILNENNFNRDWIEYQLAHIPADSTRASYNYAEYLSQRHTMMQWWADYLDKIR